MWVVLVFIITSAVAYNYRDILVRLVLEPLGDQKLIYLTPAGGFSFIFQITMYAGAVVTAPILIYHLYKFVMPALPPHAQKHSLKVVLAAVVLMLAGVSFGYFVAVPAALHFLTTFAGEYVEASLTADSYLSFILAYVAGLGVLFQLPLLLVFWNWMSPLSPRKLLSSERFVVVFAFIAAAIMTPTPDILNQALIAIPIIAIYQLGVVAVVAINRSSARRQRQHAKASVASPLIREQETAADSLPDSVFAALMETAQIEPKAQPQQLIAAPAMNGRAVDGFAPALTRHRTSSPVRSGPIRQHHTVPPRKGTVRPSMRRASIDGISVIKR